MFETLLDAPDHPVTSGILDAIDALAPLADKPMYGLRDEDEVYDLELLARLGSMVAELELRHAHAAAATEVDVKTVWVRHTNQALRPAAARLKLAAALEHHEPVRAAMARGTVNEPQAAVIVRALGQLPSADLDVAEVVAAEQLLLDLASDHHVEELHVLSRTLLRVVAPELAQAHEAPQVDAEYRRATESAASIFDRYDGTWEGRFVPAAHGHILNKLVMAFGSPGHCAQQHLDQVPGPQRMGQGPL